MAGTNEQTPLLGGGGGKGKGQEPTSIMLFRLAIGLPIPDPESPNYKPSKPAKLYATLLSSIKQRRLSYHLIDVLYYIIIITQLLLGAVIASLSAFSANHPLLITILGIVNSFTAGILALLKGQGLPDRLRKDEFGFAKVKDWIDAVDGRLLIISQEATGVEAEEIGSTDGVEWLKSAGGVEGLVKQAWEHWETARDTAEMNRPSSYAHQTEGPSALGGLGDAVKGVKKFVGGVDGTTDDGDSSGNGKGKGKFVID